MLTEQLALVPGFTSYFAFSKARGRENEYYAEHFEMTRVGHRYWETVADVIARKFRTFNLAGEF